MDGCPGEEKMNEEALGKKGLSKDSTEEKAVLPKKQRV